MDAAAAFAETAAVAANVAVAVAVHQVSHAQSQLLQRPLHMDIAVAAAGTAAAAVAVVVPCPPASTWVATMCPAMAAQARSRTAMTAPVLAGSLDVVRWDIRHGRWWSAMTARTTVGAPSRLMSSAFL